MEQLEITTTTQGGCRVVDVAGEIDLTTVRQLDDALRHDTVPGWPLVVDLADVGFCDVGGLRALMLARVRGRRQGVPVGVVPSFAVALVIELGDVRHALVLYLDRPGALAGCRLRQDGGRPDRSRFPDVC